MIWVTLTPVVITINVTKAITDFGKKEEVDNERIARTMDNLKPKFGYFVFLAFLFLVNDITAEETASELSVEEVRTWHK